VCVEVELKVKEEVEVCFMSVALLRDGNVAVVSQQLLSIWFRHTNVNHACAALPAGKRGSLQVAVVGTHVVCGSCVGFKADLFGMLK